MAVSGSQCRGFFNLTRFGYNLLNLLKLNKKHTEKWGRLNLGNKISYTYIDRSRTLKYSLNRTFLTNIKHLYVLYLFSIRLPSKVASLWVEIISEDPFYFLQFLCLKIKSIYSENLKKSPS